MITNIQLINYCEKALKSPYWYGCFGQISSEKLYNEKKKQYPKNYKWKLPKTQLNKRVFDCIGLIKGALWSNADFNKTPKYKASEDVSANGMYEKCKKTGKINTIPEIKGVLVFANGHVGVYVGNGYVIEARSHSYGVVKTKLSERKFTKWGLCPFINYIEEKTKNTQNETKKNETKKTEISYYKKCDKKYKSIVDALNSISVNSSYTNRKRIAIKNGIKNYKGSYAQNIKLLNLLKNGKLKK